MLQKLSSQFNPYITQNMMVRAFHIQACIPVDELVDLEAGKAMVGLDDWMKHHNDNFPSP